MGDVGVYRFHIAHVLTIAALRTDGLVSLLKPLTNAQQPSCQTVSTNPVIFMGLNWCDEIWCDEIKFSARDLR
jgi:hypothetical protein